LSSEGYIGLATINLPTFEDSISTHYEAIKGNTKFGKWDGFG